MRALLAGLVFLLAAAGVVADPAGAFDTLIRSGSAGNARNWSDGRPTLTTPVLIPAGKEVVVKTAQKWGDTTVEGRVAGPGSLKVGGSLTVTHSTTGAEWDLDGTLRMVGFGTVAMGGESVYYFHPEGYERLVEPLEAQSIFTGPKAILDTHGQPVTVAGELYQTIGSDILFGNSHVSASFWDSYGNFGVLRASEASMTVDGLVAGAFSDTFEAEHGDVYREVSLGGIAPVSRGSYSTGVLVLAAGTVQLETGRVIVTGSLVALGASRLEVTGTRGGEMHGEATIVCGCAVPAGVELVGVKVV